MKGLKDIVFHLVDDNDIDIAVNSKLLQLGQISERIYTYNSALKFLDELRAGDAKFSQPKNVILLDIQMPNMNGFDCLEQMAAMPEDVRSRFSIFMLSSSIDRNDIRRAESYDMVEKVLEKPLDIYLLKHSLRDLFPA